MAITILPTGFEGFADSIQRGIELGAKRKIAEEQYDREEKLARLKQQLGSPLETLQTLVGMKLAGIDSPSAMQNFQNTMTGVMPDYEQTPQEDFTMRSSMGIPQQVQRGSPLTPVGMGDVMAKKQLDFETDPMIRRGIDAKVMEKEALSEVESKQKGFDAQYKQAFESEGAFRQLEQASNVMARGIKESMLQNQSILKNLGIELDPTRGVSGLTFAKTLQVASALGYNDFADAVGEGLTTEMAVEIGKMLGQGAGMRMGKQMIGIFRKTLPNLKDGTLASNLNQLAYSMQNAYRKEVANKRDEKGNLIYKTDGERESQIMEYDALYRKKLFGMFEEAGLYTPKKILMEKGKERFEVPDYLADYFEYNKFKRIR